MDLTNIFSDSTKASNFNNIDYQNINKVGMNYTTLTEKNIIQYYFDKNMPCKNKAEYDTRYGFIKTLYTYLEDIWKGTDNLDAYNNKVKNCLNSIISKYTELELTYDSILNIHLKVINRLFVEYLFTKYNIEEMFDIRFEDMQEVNTNSYPIFGFIGFTICKHGPIGYHGSAAYEDYYTLNIGFSEQYLMNDTVKKIINKSTSDLLNMDETELSNISLKYKQYNKSLTELKKYLDSEFYYMDEKYGLNNGLRSFFI